LHATVASDFTDILSPTTCNGFMLSLPPSPVSLSMSVRVDRSPRCAVVRQCTKWTDISPSGADPPSLASQPARPQWRYSRFLLSKFTFLSASLGSEPACVSPTAAARRYARSGPRVRPEEFTGWTAGRRRRRTAPTMTGIQMTA